MAGNQRGIGIVLTQEQLLERRKTILREDEKAPIIVQPDNKDLQKVMQTSNIHGGCIHWSLEQAQKDIQDQRFWERMEFDEKYRAELFDHHSQYGYCKHFDGRLIPFYSPAVIMREDLDTSLYRTKKGMEKVVCPMYEDRLKKGSTMSISRSHVKGLDH